MIIMIFYIQFHGIPEKEEMNSRLNPFGAIIKT